MNDKIEFQLGLLCWFSRNGRELPWRKTYHPYQVWISEVMLQQTPMERVVDYFKRWLARFPEVADIAAASEEEVFRCWEGLGYYARAKNIYKTAKIVNAAGGMLPRTHRELLQLPGIGHYTAAAIMSLAYNEDYPVVDANVERVFSRLFNLITPIKDPESQRFIRRKSEELLPVGNARYFNQALMELGALVCTPARPTCERCPVAWACESHRLGNVDERPLPGKSTDIIRVEMATGLLLHHGRVLIQKRPEHGFWPNLWEFPGGRLEKDETPEEALVREYKEETELEIVPGEKFAVIKHSVTRYRLTLHGFFCTLPQESEPRVVLHEALEYRWATWDELANLTFPSPHRQLSELAAGKLHRNQASESLVVGS